MSRKTKKTKRSTATTSKAAAKPVAVKKGQVWGDNDPRRKRRRLEVIKVATSAYGRYATCRVLTTAEGKKVRYDKITEIRTDRFIPTTKGYRLINS